MFDKIINKSKKTKQKNDQRTKNDQKRVPLFLKKNAEL